MSIIFNILLLIFLIGLIIYMFYVFVLNRGAVYYPSTEKAARVMLDLAKATKKDVIIDLGSGDGVLVIEAAKKGIKAIGYEIDPLLAKQTRKRIEELGLSKLAEIRCKNMYKADFNEGTIIFVYQFPKYLKKFEKLFEKNLAKKMKVVSNRYEFPERKWDKKSGKVYLYWF